MVEADDDKSLDYSESTVIGEEWCDEEEDESCVQINQDFSNSVVEDMDWEPIMEEFNELFDVPPAPANVPSFDERPVNEVTSQPPPEDVLEEPISEEFNESFDVPPAPTITQAFDDQLVTEVTNPSPCPEESLEEPISEEFNELFDVPPAPPAPTNVPAFDEQSMNEELELPLSTELPLGSIWVYHPKHGWVRRSVRLLEHAHT